LEEEGQNKIEKFALQQNIVVLHSCLRFVFIMEQGRSSHGFGGVLQKG